MESCDVIIVADTKSDALFKMTQEAIDSLHASETEVKFNIILMESNKDWHLPYSGLYKLIYPEGEFNYNSYLCQGSDHCTSNWIIWANNDLIFHEGFFSEIMKAYESNPNIKSFGVWEPTLSPKYFAGTQPIYQGYGIAREMTGWCIVMRTSVLWLSNFCAYKNDTIKFWYADNDYADILKKQGMSHALVTNARVTHLLNQTLDTLPDEEKYILTKGQHRGYVHAW